MNAASLFLVFLAVKSSTGEAEEELAGKVYETPIDRSEVPSQLVKTWLSSTQHVHSTQIMSESDPFLLATKHWYPRAHSNPL